MPTTALYRRAIPAAARIAFSKMADGWPLRRFDWPAQAASSPRGSILYQGGRGDIFEKYLELFARFHGGGWGVTSFDWRGQGGSGRLTSNPHVGHVDDFAIYIDDLRRFYAEWAATAPRPHVVMGHSMGGHLVLRGLVEGAVTPDAAVLVAPMLGLHSPLGASLGEQLARAIGAAGNPARAAWRSNERPATMTSRQRLLTYDPDRYADELWWQQTKPELLLGPPSWKWVSEAFRSTRLLRRDPRLRNMAVPTLMLVADADQLVLPSAALAIAARLPDAVVVRFGKESAHEILREADGVRDRAIGEIEAFLMRRAAETRE